MMRYLSVVILAVVGIVCGHALHDVNRPHIEQFPAEPPISGDTVVRRNSKRVVEEPVVEWTRVEQTDDSLSHWMYVTRVPSGWLVKTLPSQSDDDAHRDHMIFVPDERHDWLELE